MANYSTLKAAVADVVKTNGAQAITGANLQSVLLSIINSVGGGGYIFKGVATPSTDAGTPDENVFYIGGAGTYSNFGTSVTVPVGSIGVFKYNGSWTKETITMFAGIDDEPTVGSDNLVKSGGVYPIAQKVDELDVKIYGDEITTDTSNMVVTSGWTPSDTPPATNVLKLYAGTYLLSFDKGTIALDSSISGYSIQIVKKGMSDASLSLIDSFSTPANKEYTLTITELTYVWVRAKGYASGVATLSAKYQGALNDVVVKNVLQTFTASEKEIARNNIGATSVSVIDGRLIIEGIIESPLVFPINLHCDNSSTKYYALFGTLRNSAKYIVDIVSNTAASAVYLYTATAESSSNRVDTISADTDIRIGHNYFYLSPSQTIYGGYINVNTDTLLSASVTINIYRIDNFSTIKGNGKFYFEDKSYDQLMARVVREKNEQNGVTPCIRFKRRIGDKFYMRLRVKFPADVHDYHAGNDDRVLFSINNGTDTFYAKLHKESTYTPEGTTPSSASQIPVPDFRAWLQATINDDAPTDKNWLHGDGWNNMFLIGEDAMSIRFKGDCSVSANQDIRIKIDDSAIKIFHNDTEQVIASYAKADYVAPNFDPSATYHLGDAVMYNGDRWVCCVATSTPGSMKASEWYRKSELTAIYEQMLSDTENNGVLSEFEVNWYNVARRDYDDLIRCEVRLVGNYKRYAPGDTPQNPTTTAFDAFPFYFTMKEKERIYDIELALDKSAIWAKSQLIVDGYGIEFGHYYSTGLFNKDCVFTLGESSNAKTTMNPEILDFTISDNLEFKYPNLKIYYIEYLKPGIADDLSTYFTSESRLCELADYLEQHDYGGVDLDNIIEYLNGGLQIPVKKTYHLSHDDLDLAFFTQPDFDRLMQTYLRHNIIPSYATVMTDNYDSVKNKIVSLQNIGYNFFIHTFSDPNLAVMATGYMSYSDLNRGINETCGAYMEKFNVWPIAWGFHQSGQNYNVIKALVNRGFQIIFGTDTSTGNGSVNRLNRYRVKRATFRNYSNLSAQIYRHVDNYLVEDL